ncbi:TonB family protein [Leptospirillum ferriphilum]|jgi:protein TonB|uniref:TonB family protein n=1 Tax=Leptospirillum ferriphilum TaxID=178606 RepID=UPI0006B2378B|nr:TonB family protein [Leptospirillum ferriphilum]OOH84109.1 energy transducer TonB [Leptospirillum ferriphilum]
MKSLALEHPMARFSTLVLLALLVEAGILLLVHVHPEAVWTPPRHKTIRIALLHPPVPPKKPVPKPARPKPHRVVKRVTKPVPPRTAVLPKATAISQNLLTAAVGKTVSLGWGSARPEQGKPSDYTPPRLLTKVDTSKLYTPRMRDTEEEGDVVILVWIGEDGKLLRYKVLVPSVYQDINTVTQNLLKTLRFDPATYKGTPVKGQFQLNFRFRIRNS